LEFIVFYRRGHVFPCITHQLDEKHVVLERLVKGVAMRDYKPLIFTSRIKSVKSGLKPSVKGRKSCKNVAKAYAKCHANVYFDFETTLSSDTHQSKYRGLQQAFLVSLTIDISIPLKAVAEAVFGKE
jgi:hypothetical protein